jgi:hypothetical protein
MRVAGRIVPAPCRLLLIAALASLSGCAMKIPSLAALEVPANPSEPAEAAFHLSEFHDIVGTPYRLAAVNDEPRSGVSSLASYSGGETRNWIFLDTRTLRSRRLFDTNRKLIVDFKQLTFSKQELSEPVATSKPTAATKWLYLEVVDQDTNRDGRLSRGDDVTIAFTDASGSDYYPAIPSVRRVLGTTMTSDDEIVVAYTTEGKSHAARIDLVGKTVTATEPLTPLTTAEVPNPDRKTLR